MKYSIHIVGTPVFLAGPLQEQAILTDSDLFEALRKAMVWVHENDDLFINSFIVYKVNESIPIIKDGVVQ